MGLAPWRALSGLKSSYAELKRYHLLTQNEFDVCYMVTFCRQHLADSWGTGLLESSKASLHPGEVAKVEGRFDLEPIRREWMWHFAGERLPD